MDDISSKPWNISSNSDIIYIIDSFGNRICSMYRKHFGKYSSCMPDAEHIIQSVNEYEKFVKEITDLKEHNQRLKDAMAILLDIVQKNYPNLNLRHFEYLIEYNPSKEMENGND